MPARARRLHALYQSLSESLANVLSGYTEPQLRLILSFFEKTNRGAAEPPSQKPPALSSVE